ncbi:permease-like cell division protein FtsX [Vibrio nigripulchritudo]|uniref:permease-like cell division protein FtsX n=1 Tax=Vibrio nigripulchritudo TaxID=28173 RepID=UPI00248FC3E5|nr:permease-like cell division protein FtsX [Vibrio nigripulchritudo]BDU38941.1 cell division protein FtsX [Vibrio nigripulchritudo]BDU44661.1 cell division protein FtsX [Vibrio nigripulchritudo]
MGANNRPKTDGFLKLHFKQAKASLVELLKRPLGNMLTFAVIAMALTLPASLYLVGKNLSVAAQGMNTSSQINAFLIEQTPEARIMVLKDELEGFTEIKAVEYVSSQQGLEDMSQHAGLEQALSLLDDYALPAVLVITPNVTDQSELSQLSIKLQNYSEVTDVRMDEDWLERLGAIRNLALILAAALGVLMLAAVFLIVGNTLRFNVLAHKEEIQVMKLIGATDSFILRPYLYTGMWFGGISAIAAWILTAIITIVLNGAVEDLAVLYDSQFRLIGLNWDETVILLMIGTALGLVAAKLSAQRHLREIEPV